GKEFVDGLARIADKHAITVVLGGVAAAHALTAADNAAGVLSVKVLRATTGTAEDGLVRALDLKGLPVGEARFAFKSGDTESGADRAGGAPRVAGGDPQRHRPPRGPGRALGRRRAAARQALAPSHGRRRVRLDSGHRATAARLELLSHPRALAVRRRTSRRA